jgi:hypothetical protein
MLDITCDHCGRVLIGPRQILSMTSTDEGIRIAYVCWCGRPGAEITGRRARATRLARPPLARPRAASAMTRAG